MGSSVEPSGGTPAVIRTPDQRLRVFISSTLQELADERAAAREAILRLHLSPVQFEVGARPHAARDLYRAYLDQSHIFVGIYWQKYGWVAPDETTSGLEDEYRLSGDKPKLIYIKSPAPDREERLKEMIDGIRSAGNVSYKYFASAVELGELIENDLMVLLTERFEMPSDRAHPTMSAVPANLPLALDRFVGRQRELQEVKDRLTGTRLLTLLGTGGTGKTRLALQAGAELRQEFDGRVFFVDLAASRDLESVLSVTGRAVGLREGRDKPLLDELKAQIRSEKMLLLLDNFEQVTVAAPAMVELLRDCPDLKLLVTSREPLHVRGESIFHVPPLALPAVSLKDASVEKLAESEAVQLFAERAQAVKSDFRLSEENAEAVAELCMRLDGLPLAIELATARLALFSPQALVERLGSRLDLLRGGARDVPVRQQTLYDTIDWSYGMLEPPEKRLLQLLSVFSGGTFEAIEAVATGTHALEIDVLDGLSSLVDKSLIRQVDPLDPRFVMLETIREFANARLEEDPAWSATVHRSHAGYFAGWTQRQRERLVGDDRDAASEQMAAEIENIRTAWRYWAAESNLDQLGRFTDSLWLLYDARGWYHATVSLTTDLLDVLAATPATPESAVERITLQTSLARVLLALKGYTQEVEDAYTRALELCEGRGGIPQLLPVLRGLSSFYLYRAEFEKGARIGEQILALAELNDDASMHVEGHLLLGANLAMLDDLKLGLAHLEQGIAAYDPERHKPGRFQLGNNPGVACLTTSALILWMLGFPDGARDRVSEAIALSKRLNHPSSTAYADFHAGLIHLWRREHESALDCADAVMDVADQYDFEIWRVVGSCLRGAALASLGSADEGLALIEESMRSYQRLNTPPVFWPMLLYLQAGACLLAARPQDGLPHIDEAIVIGSTAGKALLSEFYQLKGDLLLASSSDNADEAESCYREALETATEVQAPMLHLRAALRLGRLLLRRGETQEARELLDGVYEQFREGFETPDLCEAKSLIDAAANEMKQKAG